MEIALCGPDGTVVNVAGDAPESVRVRSHSGKTQDGRPGFTKEISIPLESLGAKEGDVLRFNAVVRSRGVEDIFTGVDANDPETWMLINLK